MSKQSSIPGTGDTDERASLEALDWVTRRASRPVRVFLRAGGSLALATALGLCVATRGWSIGFVLRTGVLTAAALMLSARLLVRTYRVRLAWTIENRNDDCPSGCELRGLLARILLRVMKMLSRQGCSSSFDQRVAAQC